MITFISLAIIAYLFYLFFIRGWAWAILLFVIGTFGGSVLLQTFFPSSRATLIAISGSGISYATVVSFLIVIMGVEFFAYHAHSD